MAILSFYTEASSDLSITETLEYSNIPGQLDLLSSSTTETEQRTYIVKKYLFVPEKIKMIIKKGMVAKDINATKYIVLNQETFTDHQEITLRRDNK